MGLSGMIPFIPLDEEPPRSHLPAGPRLLADLEYQEHPAPDHRVNQLPLGRRGADHLPPVLARGSEPKREAVGEFDGFQNVAKEVQGYSFRTVVRERLYGLRSPVPWRRIGCTGVGAFALSKSPPTPHTTDARSVVQGVTSVVQRAIPPMFLRI